ncbi:MAG: GDP-mannose 4,6-dehydratase [Patescibacteria group bacterium]
MIKFNSDKIPSIIVRFSNIYGPTKLIRPDLVPTLIRKALSLDEITVWNTKPVRDFLYTYDAADAIIKLLDNDYIGPINLGTGKSVSVGRIAEIIGDLSGKKIKDLDQPVSGPMNFVCNISRVKNLTGWEPKYSIEEGLRETYEIMKQYAKG